MSFSLQSVSAWISSRLSKTCDTAPVHTRIHLYSNTHTHKLNYKLNYLSTPSTSWKCLMQTLNMTDHKHNNTQAQTGKGKQQRKKEKKKGKNRTPTTIPNPTSHRQTDTNKHTNYWTPSTCCIAHTCSKTRETAVYGINTESEEKSFYNVSVDNVTRSRAAKEDGEIVQKYGGKKSNTVCFKHLLT